MSNEKLEKIARATAETICGMIGREDRLVDLGNAECYQIILSALKQAEQEKGKLGKLTGEKAEAEAMAFTNKANICTHAGIYNLALPIFEELISLRAAIDRLQGSGMEPDYSLDLCEQCCDGAGKCSCSCHSVEAWGTKSVLQEKEEIGSGMSVSGEKDSASQSNPASVDSVVNRETGRSPRLPSAAAINDMLGLDHGSKEETWTCEGGVIYAGLETVGVCKNQWHGEQICKFRNQSLERVSRDTARLDWLNAIDNRADWIGFWQEHMGNPIRVAIDAAMGEPLEKNPK